MEITTILPLDIQDNVSQMSWLAPSQKNFLTQNHNFKNQVSNGALQKFKLNLYESNKSIGYAKQNSSRGHSRQNTERSHSRQNTERTNPTKQNFNKYGSMTNFDQPIIEDIKGPKNLKSKKTIENTRKMLLGNVEITPIGLKKSSLRVNKSTQNLIMTPKKKHLDPVNIFTKNKMELSPGRLNFKKRVNINTLKI